MKHKLSDLASAVNGTLIGEDKIFQGVCSDTRTMQDGAVFFAFKGEQFNGEAFVERAFNEGACAAVVSKLQDDLPCPQVLVEDVVYAFGQFAHYQRQRLKAKVIAVTGSCGKTSVKGMLFQIFNLIGKTCATEANFNNHIGVPKTLIECDDDAEYLIVEAGTSNTGEIRYLTEIIDPDLALVINVHPVHVQGMGSVEAIAEEKSDIYSGNRKSARFVVNQALLSYPSIKKKVDGKSCLFFSSDSTDQIKDGTDNFVQPDTLVYGRSVKVVEQTHAQFELVYKQNVQNISLSVPGFHQVENALAAASCALSLGISMSDIAQGLNNYNGEKGRLQMHFLRHGDLLIDDSYNASPASVSAAIDVLAEYSNTVLVLGDMGELGASAEGEHQKIGRYAREKQIQGLICMGAFADDYCDGFGEGAVKLQDHNEVIAFVLEQLSGNTTVLVKGSRFTKMDTICRSLLNTEGTN